MQEEVENRTLTLIVSGTKFTGRLFKAAVSKYMAHRKEKKLEKQRSRDSPRHPQGQADGKNSSSVRTRASPTSRSTTHPSGILNASPASTGVDYAVKKDRSASPPKYLIFFKARDATP